MFKTLDGTTQTFPMEPKAIHDEMGASFDKEYGRMSTNLGMTTPIPLTNNANMTPFMYQDPATEIMTAALDPASPVLGDGTQIWKISHNGVDMHPVHFHIFDVQVINRVGWDGQIRLPKPQELGWKDTVKISPLEDTIVAMRPWRPYLPFGVPNSLRPLNPAIPIGSGFGFTNIDPVTQNPLVPPTLNRVDNFAWEYVWHCHILSHEENDMMRPIVLSVPSTVPPAMAAPMVTPIAAGSKDYTVSWLDPTPVTWVPAQSGLGNAASEIGFRIERETTVTGAIVALQPPRLPRPCQPDVVHGHHDRGGRHPLPLPRHRLQRGRNHDVAVEPRGRHRAGRGPAHQREHHGREHRRRQDAVHLDEVADHHREPDLPGHGGGRHAGRVRVPVLASTRGFTCSPGARSTPGPCP